MNRGSAPILTLEMPVDCEKLSLLHICFKQYFDDHGHVVSYSKQYEKNGKTIIAKILKDVNINKNIINVQLTEQDTLNLSDNKVYIQVRGEFNNDPLTRFTSDIMIIDANRILEEGDLDEIISKIH